MLQYCVAFPSETLCNSLNLFISLSTAVKTELLANSWGYSKEQMVNLQEGYGG